MEGPPAVSKVRGGGLDLRQGAKERGGRVDERDAEDVKRAGWRTHSSLAGVGTVGEG